MDWWTAGKSAAAFPRIGWSAAKPPRNRAPPRFSPRQIRSAPPQNRAWHYRRLAGMTSWLSSSSAQAGGTLWDAGGNRCELERGGRGLAGAGPATRGAHVRTARDPSRIPGGADARRPARGAAPARRDPRLSADRLDERRRSA